MKKLYEVFDERSELTVCETCCWRPCPKKSLILRCFWDTLTLTLAPSGVDRWFVQHDTRYEMLRLRSAWQKRFWLVRDAEISPLRSKWCAHTVTRAGRPRPYGCGWQIFHVSCHFERTWEISSLILRYFDNPCLSQPTRRKLHLCYV